MRPRDAVDSLRAFCPDLTEEIEKLLGEWLRPVLARLKAIREGVDHRPRAKHVNDPVWATFELEPQEILLIDSPLLQRLRGVKQLGLAHLVFPGANHDRFEHLCGVVNAADRMFRALQANAERRRDAEQRRHADLPTLTDNQRRLVRLAALLHDVGHGPFSHAIEPVVEARYGKELRAFNNHVKATYHLDSTVAIGELISVLVVLSPQMQPVLENSLFSGVGADDVIERQLELATLILGARRHGLPAFLSAIISGQADSDKLDYMRRDAHHSGMPIQFDTERLLSKLEIIRCTPDNLPAEQEQNRKFADDSHAGQYFDVGIAAAGVGALEQMLIGRAFLYDRLYHHHKVRAADAMAQRLLHYAKQERGGGFDLSDLYLTVSDDVMVRLLGGSLSQLGFQSGGERAASLAQRILMRDLYVRAFAFRASFHPMVEAVKDEKDRESARAEVWAPVSTALSDMADRINAEEAIVELAKQLAPKTGDGRLMDMATKLHPSHVIVDLAENRVRPVIINVHAEDGSLEVPNLFFDPARWSHVYDLQKRTGYVFCAREFVPLVALATKKYFFETWGYVVSEKADRLTKTSNALTPELIDRLLKEGAIDDIFASVLKRSRMTRTFLLKGQVSWPRDWANESADFERDLLDDLRTHLPYGFSVDERKALCDTLGGVASFIDTAHKSSSFLTSALSESDIQTALAVHLRARELKVTEGAKLSGGETDLIVSDRIVVENKIARDVTDPFAVKLDAPYQANRYATAIASRVYVVLTGYMPKRGTGLLGMTQSIRAEKVPDLDRTAVVIRAVVPYGQPPPSHEKRPPSDKRPRAGT